MREYDKPIFFILLGLSFLVSVFAIGSVPVLDPYEKIYLDACKGFFVSGLQLRLISAGAAALTAFALYLYGTKIFSERVGFWSCLVLLSFGLTGLVAKFVWNGSVFVLFFTLLVFAWLRRQYFLMVLWLVLVYVSIGPMGLVPLLAAHQSWWYYLPSLVVLLTPWTGLLPGAVAASFQDSRNEDMENLGVLHLWWVGGLIFLTIYSEKYFNMLWLIMPPLAMIIGWNLHRLEKNYLHDKHFTGNLIGSFITFVILVLAWFFLGQQFELFAFYSKVMIFVTFVMFCVIFLAVMRFQDLCFCFYLHVGVGIINMVFLFTYFLPVWAEKVNLEMYLSNIVK